MKPRGIQNELGQLPGWTGLLGPRVQTIQRTCDHPTYRGAVRFLDQVSRLAEERRLVAHFQLRPRGPAGVPSQVRVRITSRDLGERHFELAHVVEALYESKPKPVPTMTVLE